MKQPAFQMFRVAKIRCNPFRAIKQYPLQEKKIEALRESIRSTSFWPNVVARIGEEGEPELAYGHHRLEAVRQELGEDAEVQLIIRELDDAMMLRMMLRENREEWQTNALVDQASVRAVVGAYANGKIQLPPPKSKTPKHRLRHAPSFCQGYVAGRDRQHHPYTAATLAGFLGWDRTKVETTLAALELIERKVVEEDLYEGLTQRKAGMLTTEVRKVVYAHDEQAKKYEKQARTARKRAEKAKTDEDRQAQERLAKGAEREAAAVRKRGAEEADHVAWSAYLAVLDDTFERRVCAELENLSKPPPPPKPGDRGPSNDSDEIEMYLDQLRIYINHVQQVQPLAERFSLEQANKAFNGGLALQQELAALETALKEVFRERQQRGAAPVSPGSGKGKEKNRKAARRHRRRAATVV